MKRAFNKVWRDIWKNKGRTVLVVLSIAVGVFALGMTTSSLQSLEQQLTDSHVSSSPSNMMIWLNGVVDQDTVYSLSKIEGVTGIEGFGAYGIQWKTSPDDEEWQDGSLIMLLDYHNQQYDLLELREGTWPNENGVAVEFNHIPGYGAPGMGGTVYFNVNDRPRAIDVIGVLRDPYAFPPPFGTEANFYVTKDIMHRYTGVVQFNRLRLTIDDYSTDRVYEIADLIDEKLERQGVAVAYTEPLPPDEHFLQEMMDGVGIILNVMAYASLGLSAILVINTMNALIAQQIPQIGIMKAIGGTRRQITTLYLAMVLVYGLISLMLAVPLGAWAAHQMAHWMLALMNVPGPDFQVLPSVLVLQIIMGLLVPLLAALFPILKGSAIEVARALRETGLGGGVYGTRRLDRWLGAIRNIPRIAALSLRNTFRRPGRVMMTLMTLTASGAIFVMVMSTRMSLNSTIDMIFGSIGFEVMVGFDQWQRIDEVIPLIETHPDVEFAEMWFYTSGDAWVPGDTGPGSRHELYLRGFPRDTQLFVPELTEGRVLHPEDGRAMLLNQKIAREMGVGIGDQINIEIGPWGESTWTVVGLVFDLGGRDQNTAFVYLDELNHVLNLSGRGSIAQVKTSQSTLVMQKAVERDLIDFLETEGVTVSFTDTALENKEMASAQFQVLINVLLIMTVLMGAVGSMGLSGTLSINVIERRREIGVMRAVGASSRDVGVIFSGEGLMLGIISWLFAVPIGLGLGPVFLKAVGAALDFPAEYTPSFGAVWLWLGIVVILSLVASWLPARRATQISVNESLAYE